MSKLILRRIIPEAHKKEIARMQRIITAKGYEASDVDLEAAWSGFSSSLPNKPAWHPLSFFPDDAKVLEILLKQLKPEAQEIEL